MSSGGTFWDFHGSGFISGLGGKNKKTMMDFIYLFIYLFWPSSHLADILANQVVKIVGRGFIL